MSSVQIPSNTDPEFRDDHKTFYDEIFHNSEVCCNCFMQMKTTEPPKPEYAFDVTGTGWTLNRDEDRWELEWYSQEETHKAAIGFQQKTRDAAGGYDPWSRSANKRVTYCGNCGTDGRAPDQEVSMSKMMTAVGRIGNYLTNENIVPTFDVDAARDTIRELKTDDTVPGGRDTEIYAIATTEGISDPST